MGKDEKGYQKRRQITMIASLLIVVAVMVWVTVQIGEPLVRWAREPEQFQRWIEGKGAWGRLAFLGIQMLQVVIAMIPGEVFEIGAGYAFGAVEATLLCMAGTVAGSALIFALTRVLGVKLVEAFISREKIREPEMAPEHPAAQQHDLLGLFHSRYAKGPADILRGSDAHEAVHLSDHFHPGPHPVHRVLHLRRPRPWR